MTVTSVVKDPEARLLTVSTVFDAPIERVWQLWADPRQLERWWGPPTYPATFVAHDLRTGGNMSYYMTGPSGDRPRGWWQVRSVDAPYHLEFESGFADASGARDPELPSMVLRISLQVRDPGTTLMTIETRFASVDDMEVILSMGMEEGMTAAAAQMDALL